MPKLSDWSCPLPHGGGETVQLSHGSGGRMMQELIGRIITHHFTDPELGKLNDGAVVTFEGSRLAFTTDAYVVEPIFFPGGNIGDLAVNGTLNDLAMCGARPLYVSTALIIEEGFAMAELQRVLASMNQAAASAGVRIVTGDTKVVPRGKADQIFITTTGIGLVVIDHPLSGDALQPGDQIILSGTIGEHGLAILSQRESLAFESAIVSDTACVYPLVAELLDVCGRDVHALRDPTRGGLAAALNEWAHASKIEIHISEEAIPILPAVTNACELLGLDPLHIANEGKFIAAVAATRAEAALQRLKATPLGGQAAIIGEVVAGSPGLVTLHTRIGGQRIIDMPMGELLPRIC